MTSNGSSSSTKRDHSQFDPGLRFIVEPKSFALSAEERSQLADLKPAGVMFRKRNFLQAPDVPYQEWLSAYRELLSDICKTTKRDSLIISIDHEGGRVHRLPPPITRFPYPAFYSASDGAIESVAHAMGIELRSLGINVSFSPVCDIHSNPKNPVIHHRAFGETALEVSERTQRFAQALLSEGVFPCAKHFPGHGDTESDSHFSVPVVNASLEELRSRELVPFQNLIQNGIEMVMSAHIALPKIDSVNQATLSSKIMKDLLRGELGFNGVSVADALGMAAVRGDLAASSFSVRAHNAGIDLLLMVGDSVSLGDALRCRDDLVSCECDQESLMESQVRIELLLEKLPMHQVVELGSEVFERHEVLRASLGSNREWEKFELVLPGFE